MLNGLKLLMIEDSSLDFSLTKRELEKAGWTGHALRVTTAKELKAALGEPWDIVLLDVRMGAAMVQPDRALKTILERRPELPVIILSGGATPEEAVALVQMGARCFVSKGKLGELAEQIEKCLEGQERTKPDKTGLHPAIWAAILGLIGVIITAIVRAVWK